VLTAALGKLWHQFPWVGRHAGLVTPCVSCSVLAAISLTIAARRASVMTASGTSWSVEAGGRMYLQSRIRVPPVERVGLATDVLDAVFTKLSKSTRGKALEMVGRIKDWGAMEAARTKPMSSDGAVSATAAGTKSEVDNALATTYMVILRSQGAVTFVEVHPSPILGPLKAKGRSRADEVAGAGAGAGAGPGAGAGRAGTSTSDVCLVKVQTVHSTSASDILVCGPGIHVGDYVLTVRSQRKTSRELDRLVNASVLLRSANTTTAAQYPLQLLMLPHEAAFTAGAGAMPAAPVGRVRGRLPCNHCSLSLPVQSP
jgi:hypothetical protein